jgi:hypothetical protein
MLYVFSTRDRAHRGALAAGLPEAESKHVLSIPMPGAAEWAAGFEPHGVRGIIVDMPAQGYFSPLANMIPMRDWFAQQPPLG